MTSTDPALRTLRTWTLPGLELDDLSLAVPWDHRDRTRGTLEVFARRVTARSGSSVTESEAQRPYLVYLQGGPGSEAPRPTGDVGGPPWLARALRDYRVILLDQRGTGRSTPVGLDVRLPESLRFGASTLGQASPEAQAEYLTQFRADAIVADCEVLREALGVERWSLLGQSFGGFTTLSYLSVAAGSLDETYMTGGLSAVGQDVAETYRGTWQIMAGLSEDHYATFPEDRDRIGALMARAAEGALLLPSGSAVSTDRLRTLGHLLGASGGGEKLHHLLDLDPDSPAFRHDLAAALPFGGRNPLYAVLHESCYADGGVTAWAADRARPEAVTQDPTLLAGEHIHRSLFAEDPELAPWAAAADILAEHPWPRLYDEDALRASDVPGAAAVYVADPYVPLEASRRTAALLPRLRPWVTSEYLHNGLRAGGERVLDRLLALGRGQILR